MSKFLIIGICSLMILPAAAVNSVDGCRGVMTSQLKHSGAKHDIKSLQAVPMAGEVSVTADDVPYKTLIYEDFSKFTAGSESAPSSNPVNDNLQTIPDTKTLSPGWQGKEIYEAGGMAYQGAGGVLFTPDIDLSKNGGEFRVSFRMKLAPGSKSGVAYVQHQRISSQYTVRLTEQWQTVTYSFTGGVSNDYVAIRAVDPANASASTVKAFIDDVKVEIPDPSVATPTGVAYDDFDGKSFSLFWNKVAGADRYELILYTVDNKGVRHYVDGNFSTTSTEYRFEGLAENWNGYVVSVRAVSGNEVSPYSAPLAVEGIAAPATCSYTYVDASEFRASWESVSDAFSYEVRTYYEHTPANDGRFYIADTQFDFVRAADQPSEVDAAFAEMPGWFFGAAEFQDGYIGVQGAFSLLGYAAQIESPLLDLTATGGKVSVSLRVKNDDVRTGVVIALFVRDRGDYRVADEMVVSDLTKNWRTVTASLTGGTDKCILAILPTASGNLYVDDLKVYQNVKSGMTVSRLAAFGVTKSTVLDVKGLACPEGDRLCYSVRTVGKNSAGTQYIYSPESARTYVYDPAGVDAVTTGVAAVTVSGGTVYVDNADGEDICVFSITGQCVARSADRMFEFTPASQGVYIVRVGRNVRKVVI